MVFNQYAWRDGRNMGCSAQDAGELIERLEKENGEVTKESFLNASRPEDSPTHNCFEWDDTKAAEKFRLHQSLNVINAVQVIVVSEEKDNKEKRVPAFVKVTTQTAKEQASYNSISIALSDKIKREIVLKNAVKELKSFKQKYSQRKELAKVFEEIDKL